MSIDISKECISSKIEKNSKIVVTFYQDGVDEWMMFDIWQQLGSSWLLH